MSAAPRSRGLKWNTGARDAEQAPLTGVPTRVGRASKNFLDTYPLSAAAVLAVVVSGRTSADTAMGVQLYFWVRVLYVPLHPAGIPHLRTLVWAVSLWSLVKVLLALS